jgi:subtilase family serine protease
MKLGFNTSGNNQTSNRITSSVLLGKLRNTVGSTSRKFKYCNTNSPDLNVTFECVFNGLYNPSISTPTISTFETYHILNSEEIPLENITEEIPLEESSEENNDVRFKSILFGPFTPTQIKKAYSINNIIPLKNIRRPIVTIIGAYTNPYLVKDIAAFGRLFGLPACNYSIHNFSRVFSVGWAIEVTLNVQWVYAINPNSQIRIILAASNSTKDIFNAINFANNKNNFKPAINTDIMTMSLGSEDTGNLKFYNNYFTNPNTIYMASSGNNNKVTVPSCCTNVLSIGGTTLNLNSSFNRVSERVWSNSGCGYSKSFDKPSYQPEMSNNKKRISPDFCCVADPNTPCYIVLNNRAYTIGGTSLSAPIYAGMLSLVTQNRLNNKKFTYTSVLNNYNSIQPLLYNSNNKNCFFDITQGSSGIYKATEGFDLASGNGVFKLSDVIQKIG